MTVQISLSSWDTSGAVINYSIPESDYFDKEYVDGNKYDVDDLPYFDDARYYLKDYSEIVAVLLVIEDNSNNKARSVKTVYWDNSQSSYSEVKETNSGEVIRHELVFCQRFDMKNKGFVIALSLIHI